MYLSPASAIDNHNMTGWNTVLQLDPVVVREILRTGIGLSVTKTPLLIPACQDFDLLVTKRLPAHRLVASAPMLQHAKVDSMLLASL